MSSPAGAPGGAANLMKGTRMKRHISGVTRRGAPAPAPAITTGQIMALITNLLNLFTPVMLAKEGTGQTSG